MQFLRKRVVVPSWFLIFGAFSLIAAFFNRLLVPSVRWFFRSRANNVIHQVNDRLAIELPEFKLTRREERVGRLVYDAKVLSAIEAEADSTGVPRDVLFERVEQYAREIVPAFNAYVYFQIGIGISRRLTDALYNVRLGYVDQAGLQQLNRSSDSLVFVMNHRSNMDYVLLGHIAMDYVALSYAVGEWANVFPVKQLISAMGAFFVRRGSGNALYRRVLERYVQQATEAGVVQAMFPEGRLTRDGKLQEPRLGLLDYMLRATNTKNERDLILVPVAVNYDLVVEDDTQVQASVKDAPTLTLRQKAAGIRSNWRLLSRRGLHGFGFSVINVGTPISLREWATERCVEFDQLPKDARIAEAKLLANQLMDVIGELVPVLPVSVLANVFVEQGGWISAETIHTRNQLLLDTLAARGAHVYIPRKERTQAIASGLSLLELRGLIEQRGSQYRANPSKLPLLHYYANSIAHLLPTDLQ